MDQQLILPGIIGNPERSREGMVLGCNRSDEIKDGRPDPPVQRSLEDGQSQIVLGAVAIESILQLLFRGGALGDKPVGKVFGMPNGTIMHGAEHSFRSDRDV